MIHALIVVESCFGATSRLAEALAAGLREAGARAEVLPASQAGTSLPAGLDLLVLAAPTHNRGLPTTASRAQAARRGAPTPPSTGVREWLEAAVIPPAVRVAAADTVTGRSWFSGSAAKDAAKRLRRAYGRADVICRSFLVGSVQGPLANGEEEAARAWGRHLAQESAHDSEHDGSRSEQ